MATLWWISKVDHQFLPAEREPFWQKALKSPKGYNGSQGRNVKPCLSIASLRYGKSFLGKTKILHIGEDSCEAHSQL